MSRKVLFWMVIAADLVLGFEVVRMNGARTVVQVATASVALTEDQAKHCLDVLDDDLELAAIGVGLKSFELPKKKNREPTFYKDVYA